MDNSKNIFVQILSAERIINDNIVALADNLNTLMDKIEAIENILNYTEPEPDASGNGMDQEQIGG